LQKAGEQDAIAFLDEMAPDNAIQMLDAAG
jgi:hypothetical protein